MKSERLRAGVIGGLFLTATAMGVLTMLLIGPLLSEPDLLAAFHAQAGAVRLAVLMDLVMAASVVAIAVAFHPLVKGAGPSLALGFVAARLSEGIFLALAPIGWLGLLLLGPEYVAGPVPAQHLVTLSQLLAKISETVFSLGGEVAFGASAVLLNLLLWRSRLVPRFLSLWGGVGGALILAKGGMLVLGMAPGLLEVVLTLPIALNEMVLALWLIARGVRA